MYAHKWPVARRVAAAANVVRRWEIRRSRAIGKAREGYDRCATYRFQRAGAEAFSRAGRTVEQHAQPHPRSHSRCSHAIGLCESGSGAESIRSRTAARHSGVVPEVQLRTLSWRVDKKAGRATTLPAFLSARSLACRTSLSAKRPALPRRGPYRLCRSARGPNARPRLAPARKR